MGIQQKTAVLRIGGKDSHADGRVLD
jgi:hypothetical protein